MQSVYKQRVGKQALLETVFSTQSVQSVYKEGVSCQQFN
jgi:hypothetical protein